MCVCACVCHSGNGVRDNFTEVISARCGGGELATERSRLRRGLWVNLD